MVNGDRAEFVVPNTVVQQGSGYAGEYGRRHPQNYWERIGLPEIMVYQRFIPIAPPMSVCVISPLATSSIDRC